jgi:hypothetical protein
VQEQGLVLVVLVHAYQDGRHRLYQRPKHLEWCRRLYLPVILEVLLLAMPAVLEVVPVVLVEVVPVEPMPARLPSSHCV